MSNPSAWLEIDIGDSALYDVGLAAWQRAQSWLKAVGGPQYGMQGPVEVMEPDQQQLLLDSYAADPVWSSQGLASVHRPPPLCAGRLQLELFQQECPKTVANFLSLCTGDKGLGKASKKPLHLKGCSFHRIVTGFCCQGGDIVRGDGSGGDSIYGGAFKDEKQGLALKHDAMGVLSMANSGKNSNTSQFFITLAPAPQCDGKHVVFGRVTAGLDILTRINAEAASPSGAPRTQVTIAASGVGLA
eukprot:CAMPEP_0119108288 /NCGR_PEP_ID=MMETSP1180-20130426/13569_1 /TAXON_ID=3052 ORGANISM="Chlamydomonas cf sp, Strain CCMP681" /NCGR_SAMPLE_ID=MMETSP1180 /ASSEMBLY_ACC=CAM_ASM_000741 /LENGTH=243 /DNA_ID=CAMNT_0007093885 /DNA_START=8 /DNA_END=739 /DNA_ORIENTATION=+